MSKADSCLLQWTGGPSGTHVPCGRNGRQYAGALILAVAFCLPADTIAQNNIAEKARSPAAAAADRPAASDMTAESAADAQRAVDRMFDDPLGGVVVNRTVTVLGKDFYRYFSTHWRHTDESTHYSISIHERPTARFGSEIWVMYRQQRMFHIFLPPARQATRGISAIAVQQVLENISRRELERLTTRNPDLGPEEL